MLSKPKIGVFLCNCGSKISSLIDLISLKKMISQNQTNIDVIEIFNYSCLHPGLDKLIEIIIKKKLNRIVIGGCEGRIILEKFEKALSPIGIFKGQVEILNLRGHVGLSNNLLPIQRSEKSMKLIISAVEEMRVLKPTINKKIVITAPVMLLGNGISLWPIAKEFDKNKIDFLVHEKIFDVNFIGDTISSKYPGDEKDEKKLTEIRTNLLKSKHLSVISDGTLVSMSGLTGDYELVFMGSNGKHNVCKVGTIVYCSDCDLNPQSSLFSYNGTNVVVQNEFTKIVKKRGLLGGNIVFWINDYKSNSSEFADLSFKSSFLMAKKIREQYKSSKVTILYDEQMSLPVLDRKDLLAKKHNISLFPYSSNTQPRIQKGIVYATNIENNITSELPWDYLVLSPKRVVNSDDLKVAKILNLTHKKNGFLDTFNPEVQPGQQGAGGIFLAGSSQTPCCLEKSIVSGYRIANQLASLIHKSRKNELFVPRIVCSVDEDKCVGCGLAKNICENSCFEITGSGSVTKIDPMLCTGGGTCTAACPYNALTLQNSTTEQREKRISTLSKQIKTDEIIVVGCSWGGLASADIAGKKNLIYDSRAYILGVPCVGQLDPCVLARSFLDGASGLILIGCYPECCHHSHGIDHAWSRVDLIKKLLRISNLDSRRISLAHADFNKPNKLVEIINPFNKFIAEIGPIEKNKINLTKLKNLYYLTTNNLHVRHLLCTNLRSISEDQFLGNQENSLNHDVEFCQELKNELIQVSILNLLKNKPTKHSSLVKELDFDRNLIHKQLLDMSSRGVVTLSHTKREATYSVFEK